MDKPVSVPKHQTISCRRVGETDRRQAHFKAALTSFFRRRRADIRRDRESKINSVIAQIKPFTKAGLVLLLLFIAFDAILGVTLISMGSNANDTFDLLLTSHSLLNFFIFKSIVAAACVLTASTYPAFKQIRSLPQQYFLYGFIALYLSLLLIQISVL